MSLTAKEIKLLAKELAKELQHPIADIWISEDEAMKLTDLKQKALREQTAGIVGCRRYRKTKKELSTTELPVRRGWQYNKTLLEENLFIVI